MKIGIDCRLINKIQNTGISRYTEFLIDYYIDRFKCNNVYLITNDLDFSHYGCNVHFTSLQPYSLKDFFFFHSFIGSLKLDIFHSPFYSAFFIKPKFVRSIVTVHDLMFKRVKGFFNTNNFLNYLKIKYFDFIVESSLKNADILISISETTQRDILDFYHHKSYHIPEHSEINQLADKSYLKCKDLDFKRYYFYCGNSRPHKNLQFIISYFNANLEKPPLVLAGKGHVSSNNVIAVGIVSDAELKSLYEGCIAFIFPSKFEGFGLPILEALRSKTLVIASRISAFLEFDSKNIYFFELNNVVEFMEAIDNTCNKQFIEEPRFFEKYSEKYIYDLNDKLLKALSNFDKNDQT